LHVERQRPVPLVYEAVKLDCGFRADLVVENRLVVECKCKEVLPSTKRSCSRTCGY
jgi:GxxExxY protein